MATIERVGRLVGQDPGHSAGLEWTDEHPASHYGLGVLLLRPAPGSRLRDGQLLDGESFRSWRDSFGHRIEATPEGCRRVILALGVPADEPGIIPVAVPS
jgi:hypothetical protein